MKFVVTTGAACFLEHRCFFPVNVPAIKKLADYAIVYNGAQYAFPTTGFLLARYLSRYRLESNLSWILEFVCLFVSGSSRLLVPFYLKVE